MPALVKASVDNRSPPRRRRSVAGAGPRPRRSQRGNDSGVKEESLKGRPIRLDPDAESADPSLPAFLARPEGSRAYHGFALLDAIEVDGFIPRRDHAVRR
jgi:hypothetical protein